MNTIGKILVVFIAAASLSFLAFAGALRNGGLDWVAEMKAPDLQKEFVFSTEAGEKTTYSVRHRRSDTAVLERSPVQADTVLSARKRLEVDNNKLLQELNPQPAQLQAAIKSTQDSIVTDKKGVEIREQELHDLVAKTWGLIQSVGDALSEFTIQTQEVLKTAQERREEAYRLTNQLDMLRNDTYAAIEQKKVLQDELRRLEDNRRRLERRNEQLKQQLGEGY